MQKLLTIFLVYFLTSFVALLQAQDVNTLLEQLEYQKESEKKVDILYKIGMQYQMQNAYKKAIEYYTEAKRNEENNLSLINVCNQKILQSYMALKDYNNALKTVEYLIESSKQSNDQEQFLRYLNEGVELAELAKNYEKAIEFNEKLVDIYKPNNDFNGLGRVYNNLGVISRRNGNDIQSSNYFNNAIENNKSSLENKNNSIENQVFTNINTGITYIRLKQYSKANPYFNQALTIAQKSGNQKLLASAYNYLAMNDYLNDKNSNAIGYATKAKQIAEDNYDTENELDAYKVLALLYQSEEDYKESKTYNDKYLELVTKLEKQKQEEIQRNLQFEIEIEKKEAEFKNSLAERQQQRLTLENQQKELAILKQEQALQLSKIREQQLEEQRTKNMLELTKQKAETDRQKAETEKQKLLTQVQQREATLQAEKARSSQKIAQEERKAKEASLEKGKLQEDKLKQQFWINLLAIGIVVLILGILFFVNRTLRQSKKLNNELAKKNNIIVETNQVLQDKQEEINTQNEELNKTNEELSATLELVEKEKEKSDALLLNILPSQTAQELKETGRAVPKYYDMVSVLFTDFKGFTQITEKLEPQQVIEELNRCFLAFDEICEKYNLEKIKTIGDSYMCAGGIPIANNSNPEDCVSAGLEMQAWMENWKAEKTAKGETAWELRLGIHSGPVVAGVIGKNKFAYDIWGETVNSASRMESTGEVGKVNISGATYQLVKDKFHFTYRGKVEFKNRGEAEMYFVNAMLPQGGHKEHKLERSNATSPQSSSNSPTKNYPHSPQQMEAGDNSNSIENRRSAE